MTPGTTGTDVRLVYAVDIIKQSYISRMEEIKSCEVTKKHFGNKWMISREVIPGQVVIYSSCP
jgi:hypothetical protein